MSPNRRSIFSTISLLSLSLLHAGSPLAPTSARAAGPAPAAERAALPMRFEPNRGQTAPEVSYVARGAGYTVFLAEREAVLSLGGGEAVRLRFAGSRGAAAVRGEGALAGASAYIAGDDPSRWVSGVPGFERVRYEGVYPGVDAVFYGNQRRLEYDFVVAPGADPGAVRVAFDGVDEVASLPDGSLVLRVGDRSLVQPPPVAYQGDGEARRTVAARYSVSGREVGFALGEFDRSLPLVIDPVLSYSTYLGGSGFDEALAIAVDAHGSTYVVGSTGSLDFPRAGGLQIPNRGMDAFVAKLDPSGSQLVYSTYLGGTGDERAYAVVVDAAGNAYVAGSTTSVDFPIAFGLSRRGAGSDVFVAKLNPAGSALVFSSAFGGGLDDSARAIAVDASGAAHVTGSTASSDFPTQLAIQIGSGEGQEDAFVSKLDPSGVRFAYSTYLGGGGRDIGLGIAIDASGGAVVVGGTSSANFPVRRALQQESGGGRDGFVSQIAASGVELAYSTYLGGAFNDAVNAVAVGPDGGLFLTGQTFSDDFPTATPAQETNSGGGDAFVTKFDLAKNTIVYSTFLGGTAEDQGNAIAVDPTGSAFVAGFTASTNFPTRLQLQSDPNDGATDAFVTKLNTLGNRLAYSTYFGGGAADRADGIAVDESGNAYIAGTTLSTNLPVQDPIVGNRDAEDGFVTKIGDAFADVSVALAASPEPVRSNDVITYTATVQNAGPDVAGNVEVSMETPAGTVFESAESSAGTCAAPDPGEQGEVRCHVGRLDSGATATVTIRLRVTASAGATLLATARATTTAADTATANDAASATSSVAEPVDPPVVTSVRSLRVPGKPYRIRIDGANLQPGALVFVGDDATPWPNVKYKNGNRIVLKQGGALKSRFPKGVPVAIRIVNPDGGEATTSFTR